MTFDTSAFFAKFESTRKDFIKLFGVDFDRTVKTFELNKVEQAKVDEWVQGLRSEIIAIQKAGSATSGIDDTITGGEPYYGAVDGGLSYTFIPTGLGTIITVKETITGKKLNVSEACDWHFYG